MYGEDFAHKYKFFASQLCMIHVLNILFRIER